MICEKAGLADRQHRDLARRARVEVLQGLALLTPIEKRRTRPACTAREMFQEEGTVRQQLFHGRRVRLGVTIDDLLEGFHPLISAKRPGLGERLLIVVPGIAFGRLATEDRSLRRPYKFLTQNTNQLRLHLPPTPPAERPEPQAASNR